MIPPVAETHACVGIAVKWAPAPAPPGKLQPEMMGDGLGAHLLPDRLENIGHGVASKGLGWRLLTGHRFPAHLIEQFSKLLLVDKEPGSGINPWAFSLGNKAPDEMFRGYARLCKFTDSLKH